MSRRALDGGRGAVSLIGKVVGAAAFGSLSSCVARMNYEDAVNMILMHGIGRDDVPLEEALLENGFLGCLRPFSGLREENFLKVMQAIIALKAYLASEKFWELRL